MKEAKKFLKQNQDIVIVDYKDDATDLMARKKGTIVGKALSIIPYDELLSNH